MSRDARRLLAFAALCLALSGHPSAAQPPVWTVRGPAARIVIFGSVHVLPAGLDWTPPSLERALAEADSLWLEIPLDAGTDALAARLFRARGRLAAGQSLTARLPPASAERLRRVAAHLGLAIADLEVLRPWAAELAISEAADAQAGATAAQGVEWRLQDLAPARARRRAFESVDQQIDILAGAAFADQVASLDETLREIDEQPDAYRQMVAAWEAGDLAAIDAQVLAPLKKASPVAYDRLIVRRNRRWARTIEAQARGGGTAVVVVGVGHLIGSQGVPALLRARGLTVEGP